MPETSLAESLNRSCHCINVDAQSLGASLASRLGETGAYERLRHTHPHLLADAPVFIGRDQIDAMQQVVDAIERVVRLPAYEQAVLASAPAIARTSHAGDGVFFGYDFHLTADGPRLIEINTNAGGALLLLHLSAAQQACCAEVGQFVVAPNSLEDLEDRLVDMFRQEFAAATSGHELRRVAIVDEQPATQYLLPEFELFRNLFDTHGIDAVIAAPEELEFSDGALLAGGRAIDLVYSRLTDFYLQSDPCRALRDAYARNAVVVTPGPRAHALYANKRNLAMLCDGKALQELGASHEDVAILTAAVPRSEIVGPRNADDLWARRRQLYFKPASGFGSRGTYSGAKLTRRTWAAILDDDYIAQALVAPGERVLDGAGGLLRMKVDVRCYAYRGDVQLLGARLYRGQTTNFRTASGGLAAVFTAPTG